MIFSHGFISAVVGYKLRSKHGSLHCVTGTHL
jgi:hypothetical protein